MLWRYERMAVSMGYSVIAGVDEVGMGPLAGPSWAARSCSKSAPGSRG